MEQQRIESTPMAPPGVKLIAGLFFAVLGILMALDNLDVFDAWRVLAYWPLALIAVGVLKFMDAGSRAVGLMCIAAGALLLALNVRWIRLSIFDFWPLVLIGIGVFIVAQAMGITPRDAETKDVRNVWSVLSARKVVVESRDYTGGRCVSFMGGTELDLTNAAIANGPAVIEALVIMGGLEIRVPDGWEVVCDALPFMGGSEVRIKSKSTGSQLIVRGLVMWGGLEIKDAAARNK
jgi:predicted membrane protein